jgi:protein gp37
MVFVNSMGDLFHEDIPETFIVSVFNIMKQAYWHRFQVLTKREDRLVNMAPRLEWPSNIWMGVTVEDKEAKCRIRCLQRVPAAVRFLSIEPLLESLGRIDLKGIQWVIVGGESGPGARPMQKAWVEEIKRQCEIAKVAFFFKQWGGVNKRKAGRLLNGKLWEDVPEDSGQMTRGQVVDLRAQ